MKTFKDMTKSGELKRADARKIKLEDIHPEPGFNVRQQGEALEAHIENLKEYILSGGQLPALEVRPREDGGVWIVDGHSRHEAYKRAKAVGAPIEWISVVPFTGNDADRIARMMTSNEGLKLTPLETAFAYKRLRGLGLDNPAIAKLVHKTPQHVGQVLLLADADTSVQQAVKDGDISPTAAVAVVKQHGDKAGEQIQVLKTKAQSKGKTKVTGTMATRKLTITREEATALDVLISRHHKDWKEIAEGLMDEDARRHLEARLAV